jgi:DNA polymerase III gamma/tau subunit
MRAKVDEFNDSSIFGINKVYIFDEPQRLSGPAMSALLIPSENLRKNVLVILCSMEPEKVESALSDRFIRLKTKLLDKKVSMEFINYVCSYNSIILDKFKKVLIADKSNGNPRRIINAIPKIIDIEDVKDIEYLLDINSIEEDKDTFMLFKLLLANAEWKKVAYSLNELLKSNSPNTIRLGILSLIGNGLLRGFGAGKEKKLIYMYDILKDAYQIPEKATLVAMIGKICLGERR